MPDIIQFLSREIAPRNFYLYTSIPALTTIVLTMNVE